jgi:hypothetical protein
MAKIQSPNPQYNDVTNGVQFTNGVGETSDESKLGWFREHGYTVEQEGDNNTSVKVQSVPFAEAEAGAANPEYEGATTEALQASTNEKSTRSKK